MSAKEAKQMVREAERQGWRVEDTKDGWMCYSPDGVTIVNVHRTPSDWRAWRNTKARFRQGGLVWPPPGKKGKG